jgi:hypothetical protein
MITLSAAAAKISRRSLWSTVRAMPPLLFRQVQGLPDSPAPWQARSRGRGQKNRTAVI